MLEVKRYVNRILLKNTFKIIIGFLAAILLVGCSTKKDAYLNRKYHATTTKYNILYNGEEAFKYGLESLNANYEDNFWEILPVEPLKVDELALPGMSTDSDNSPQEFERAEEKSVKAIQKHSMLIARQERNSQIDDAYLLLGKSRYYTKRFVPALEAFNYVLINYPNASLINETKVWQAKTLVRLKNEEQAISNLKELLKNETLESEIIEDANTALAMAYSNLDSVQHVLNHLNKSVLTTNRKNTQTRAMFTENKTVVVKPVLTTKNPEQTARNLFIIGQLYNSQNKIDSSNIAFKTLINYKKAPNKYVVRGHLEKIKNIESIDDALGLTASLKKLMKNPYNYPYMADIYFGLGEIARRTDLDKALFYYNQSNFENTSSNYQKEVTYEAIGNIYFDKANFSAAGAYYDSILQISKDPDAKRIRRLVRKRNNLDEVISYENISKRNDSILAIVAMSESEKATFFGNYIKDLIAADIRKKELEELNEVNSGSSFFGSKNNNRSTGEGKWYFYNTQVAGFGQQEFRNVWGNRTLEDNWRLSEKISFNVASTNTSLETIIEIDQSKKYELSYYLDKIPTDQNSIDSISKERNQAYYKLGIIYQNQFKEAELGIYKLENLLTFNPSEDLIIPAKYHLYKMYDEIGDYENATKYKNEVITNYPDSRYAKIILNPSEFANEDRSNSPESIYAAIFYEYDDGNFDSVIEKTTQSVVTFEGHPLVPKFELLKAYAIGKKLGLTAFKEALDFVVTNYPNTEEGKKAAEIFQTLNSKIE